MLDLTDRQIQILQGLWSGKSHKELARSLRITPKTVEFHTQRILKRCRLNNRLLVFREALRQGLLQP